MVDEEQVDVEVPGDAAALLQGWFDQLEAIQLWDALAKRYRVYEDIVREMERAESRGDEVEQSRLAMENLQAVEAAVRALQQLNHADI